MSAPRVALIGARRARQGLGPFVARDLHAAGAQVSGFLTTRPESSAQAALSRRAQAGVEARGYLDLEELIDHERPDALAILSPAQTHAGILRSAARAGLHGMTLYLQGVVESGGGTAVTRPATVIVQ